MRLRMSPAVPGPSVQRRKTISMKLFPLVLPSLLHEQVQTGGGRTRRLEENEYPLLVQEEFLRSLGYFDESRRARLGIDPELKHLIRFHIGPAEIPMCKGVLRSGTVEVLKGLVFPQWRRRHLAIVGSKLILYPGK